MATQEAFIEKWRRSAAAERANAQMFLTELCDALGVPRPDAAVNDAARDRYVFEKVVPTPDDKGGLSSKRIDLYKEGCFILEAKQGGAEAGGAAGAGRRGSQLWHNAMQLAYGQALGYARSLDRPPPFLLVADVGYCFELYASFDGTANYRHFPSPQKSRIFLASFAEHADMLRAIFTDPWSLDPSRAKVAVTRDVAGRIAQLAAKLEADGRDPVVVAKFLMRCLFTMFAEDVGLLPEHLFTVALETVCIQEPRRFAPGMEHLWHAMNTGGLFGFEGRLPRFNGGLFAMPEALPLTAEQLKDLLAAARCDWAEVEPAIFGTLLERALDKDERHKLGAHYTPRAYVERLVRPTIEEPVRNEWEIVRGSVRQLRADDKIEQAKKEVHAFHRRLCNIRVLDPACGTGNFLYVTLDVFKRIEAEIFQLLSDLGEAQQRLELHYEETVTPRQFLGIEVKPWAKEIAELVLWIGYLQWHFRTFGKVSPPEPVLHDHKNIECRDAVLAWDKIEIVRDERGRPVTRWDGKTMKRHPVTGEEVPDENARVEVVRYVNPRKAEWPEAEFIIGNPPFIGTKRMRSALGHDYVDALREIYSGSIEDNADLVMFWWDRAADLVEANRVRRAGLITTNSITQSFNRRVLQAHIERGCQIVWAIPDHPWSGAETGAAVRIAMTCLSVEPGVSSRQISVVNEVEKLGSDARDVVLAERTGGVIHPDLRMGPNVVGTHPLKSNERISGMGVALHGPGFVLEAGDAARLASQGPTCIRRFISGRDITQDARERYVIDFSGMTEAEARALNPGAFQHLMNHVYPERIVNRRESIRRLWWRFGWERPELFKALAGLSRYVATTETAKHRIFVFLASDWKPEHKLVVLAIESAFHFGVLSSRIHGTWALAAGGRLEDRPVYTKTYCFDPFPFPACTDRQKARIRDLGERLDAHRKRQQAQHPDLTITGMYNVLEKLRAGEALSAKDKVIHEQGLVTLLKQIHDELDAAVFEAYGWPKDLTDEQILERLVALNAERAEEEKKGLVRWLRPDFQNPGGKVVAAQFTMAGTEAQPEEETAAAERAKAWPRKMPEQIAAVRDLLLRSTSTWSEAEVQGAFKGAKRKEVAAALETLVALGIGVAYGGKDEVRYRAAGRAVA